MEERKLYQYPPYTYLAKIEIKGLEQTAVVQAADILKDFLVRNAAGKRINVYGPLIPYIGHINGRYYRQILLKYKSEKEADELLDSLLKLQSEIKNAEISIDVDPQDAAS